MARTILVAGTMAFDTIETPLGRKEKILGGSANYFAIASSIFTSVELSAVVGEDFPKEHLEYLKGRRIGTSNVEVVSGKTFHWFGRYVGAMNEAETLDTHLNALSHYDPKLDDKGKACELLFLANVDPIKQYKVINEASSAEVIISDTMNFWIESNPNDLKRVLTKTNILIINEVEARMLSNEVNIMKACEKIVKMGPGVLIIKRGEYGAFVYKEGERNFYVPAYPVRELCDPTGAGDSFAGGFTGYLATSPDPMSFNEIKKAMVYGTAAASFTVQGFGIESISNTTERDLKERYDDLISMMVIK